MVAQTANPKPTSPSAKPSSTPALMTTGKAAESGLVRLPDGRMVAPNIARIVLRGELIVAILDKNTPPFAWADELVDGARNIRDSRGISAPESRDSGLPVKKTSKLPSNTNRFREFGCQIPCGNERVARPLGGELVTPSPIGGERKHIDSEPRIPLPYGINSAIDFSVACCGRI